MPVLQGVYVQTKKDGTVYYRASLTYLSKHISLGSFDSEQAAFAAYELGKRILSDRESFEATGIEDIENYVQHGSAVSFDKWVLLVNLRDNGIYCRNPIYLQNKYFLYYLDPDTPLKFDTDDLFYYMNHKIMRRGGHLFVADYGMQVNIASRYGIKNFGVSGRDYLFVNGDRHDFRYGNIEIINRYHGVTKDEYRGQTRYTSRIHVNGDTIIGRYTTEQEAAVAYNKAVALLHSKGIKKDFPINYTEELNEVEYAKIYNRIHISKGLRKIYE